MLDFNKNNEICNEIIKLCTHINIWSDKKLKKTYKKLKCDEIVEKHVALEKKCWKNEVKVKWN